MDTMGSRLWLFRSYHPINSTTKPETASILITSNIVDDTRLEWLTLVCQMFNFAVKIEQFM
jgi:hypothetical protein